MLRTLMAVLALVGVTQAQQPMPGFQYPDHVFRTVVPVPKGAALTQIHAAGFHAYPLRHVYATAEFTGVEYVGYRSFEGVREDYAPREMELLPMSLRIDGATVQRLDLAEADLTIQNELLIRRHWRRDMGRGVIVRVWHNDYAGGDYDTAVLVSNSDASRAEMPLKDRQVEFMAYGESQSGLLPPTYGKAFRFGSKDPSAFYAPFWFESGVGLLGTPSRHLVKADYDGAWLDEGRHFGFHNPIGVQYGGMTGGIGIQQFPELASHIDERTFVDQIRYHDRQSMELEFELVPDQGNPFSFDHKFLRGQTGNFHFEDPEGYYEPKSDNEIRIYDAIDLQHAIRGMRYDVQLAWRMGDSLSCYWLERWGDWAEMTFRGKTAVTEGGRVWGRAEAWGLKAIACREAIERASDPDARWDSLADAISGSALPSGLFQAVTWSKMATSEPYNSQYWVGRSQEQLFLSAALLEYGYVVGDDKYVDAARGALRGLLNVAWWSEGSAGFVDRYVVGEASGEPEWTRSQIDYSTFGLHIFHDSFDTGNLPALLAYAYDLPTAAQALVRVSGRADLDIDGCLAALGWSAVAPGRTGSQRLGRAPYANYGLSYELLWGLR